MNETRWDAGFSTEWSSPVLDDIVELPLLLLRQEADALERAARRRNTTPGELLRAPGLGVRAGRGESTRSAGLSGPASMPRFGGAFRLDRKVALA